MSMIGRLFSAIVLIVLVVRIASVEARDPCTVEKVAPPPLPAFDSLIEGLSSKTKDELTSWIHPLVNYTLPMPYTDTELRALIAQLYPIEFNDDYLRVYNSYGKGSRSSSTSTDHPNREYAIAARKRIEFELLASPIRRLPIPERLDAITKQLLTQDSGGWARSWWSEFADVGPESTPYLVRNAKRFPSPVSIIQFIQVNPHPRGVEYLITILADTNQSSNERVEAAEVLGCFEGNEVIEALVEALRDEEIETVYANAIELQCDRQERKPVMPMSMRPIVVEATRSLNLITDLDWGHLYKADYRTWREWFDAPDRSVFDPRSLRRSDAEIAVLVERLIEQFMLEWPTVPAWNPTKADREAMTRIARDLHQLGPVTVDNIILQFQRHVLLQPVWRESLSACVRELLTQIDLPESEQALKSLLE